MEIEEIEKVHTIGYRLKDAKVTVNQDFKYNVAGIKIEGVQGDTNNMPEWIGKILNDSGIGTMDVPDMITELKQALSKEKMVGEYQLSTLEPHFYIKLKTIQSTDCIVFFVFNVTKLTHFFGRRQFVLYKHSIRMLNERFSFFNSTPNKIYFMFL